MSRVEDLPCPKGGNHELVMPANAISRCPKCKRLSLDILADIDPMWGSTDGPLGHYDRQGNRISLAQWAKLNEGSQIYKLLARTTIFDAGSPDVAYDVSTVWLGLDHGFMSSVPLIFETIVFGEGSHDHECLRYATEDQAHEGHDELVTLVRAEFHDPVIAEAWRFRWHDIGRVRTLAGERVINGA